MTSASTKRRHKNARSVRASVLKFHRFANTWLDGVDSNIRHKRQAAARAQVQVVRNAMDDLPELVEAAIMSGGPHANAEIQRLRAAMVHAMDDAEWGAKNAAAGTKQRKRFQEIASRLKTALEKK
jgi:hypothetical protein